MTTQILTGVYKHYKGNYYYAIDIANHSETLEQIIVYRAIYGNYDLWVRPLSMWEEEISIGSNKCKRFTKVNPSELNTPELQKIMQGFSKATNLEIK